VLVDGVAMNAEVAEDLQMYAQLGIPPGVYMLDRPWSEGEFGFANFRWDALRFPNIDGMLAVLRDRGYRLAVWSAALAAGSAPGDNGTEARQLGYLAPGIERFPMTPAAQLIDLTNPDARRWWAAKHSEWIERYDVSAIKLDRGEEYVSLDPAHTYFDGRNAREVHNDYPVANIAMYHDFMRAARGDGDFVVKARAGYAGAQRHGIFWGGDMPGATALGNGPGTDLGLRTALIALQRAGFMGFPFWGSDTGGYYQFKQRDVFARWLEFSAFCPLMNIGGVGPHAPWDMPTEPHYDEEMIAIYRRYVQLHHDLVPYVMRHAARASETGLPIARPLVFDFPDDPNVRDRWDEYLYGDDLLVAPLWQNGARAREVYLPAGRWEDFWDGSRVFEGPVSITADAPLDVIPVFVRMGAEIPGRP
jgi:alpha-glucosidase (family GH31 glycosyl hydrolase)